MTDNSKIASWVLAGLAVGAAAYYLFGTSSGKELCHDLIGKDLIDKATKAGESIKRGVKDKLDNLSDKATNIADKANSQV